MTSSPSAPESETPEAVHAQLARKGPNFRGRIRDVIKALRGENEKTVDRAVGHLIGCCKGEMIFRRVALKEIERLERTLSLAQTEIKGLRTELAEVKADLAEEAPARFQLQAALGRAQKVQSRIAELEEELLKARSALALAAEDDMGREELLRNAEKDAARYRWLRDCTDLNRPIAIFFDSTKYGSEVNTPEATDAAIDAALKDRA